MAQRLSDIKPGELSFVRRGAVRRPFLFMKGDDEQVDLDESIAKALEESPAGELEFLKAHFGDEAEPEEIAKAAAYYRLAKSIGVDPAAQGLPLEYAEIAKAEEPVYKRDFSADDRRALAAKGHALPDGSYPIESSADIKSALTLAQSGHGDTTAAKALIKKRAKDLGATDLLPDEWNVQKEDDDMSETATAVPVKKEDGTWDLTAVPDDQRPAVEAVIKAHDEELAELRKSAEADKSKADEAIEIAKSEREQRLTTVFLAKSEEVGQDAEFGAVLKTISEAVDADTFEKLESVLKAAHERAVTAGIFEELGSGNVAKNGKNAELEAKVEEIQKSDSSLSREQAYTRAIRANPELVEA